MPRSPKFPHSWNMADVMAPLSGDEADVEEENEREGKTNW